ncbi:hypothetical protein L204_103372 [Cryptococcus depauperatus]|nr:hypothetical protein L204_01690 [Cryptococcus depauperatus CBS 7855]
MPGLLDSIFGGADANPLDPNAEKPSPAVKSNTRTVTSIVTASNGTNTTSQQKATPVVSIPTTTSATTSRSSTLPISAVTNSSTSSTQLSKTTTSNSTSTDRGVTNTGSSTTSQVSITSAVTTSQTTSDASSTASIAGANSKGSSSKSGLSTGAIVGIVIACIVGVVIIAWLATSSLRRKRKADRAKRRSSVFDWPATGMQEGQQEKSRYELPSQSFAMSEPYNNNRSGPGYSTNEAIQAAGPTSSAVSQIHMERHNPQVNYRNSLQSLSLIPPLPPGQGQNTYSQQPNPHYQQSFAGAGGAASHIPQTTVTGGSWVRVKVGFVRSMEDELAIAPGQKLYLHEVYDDDWTLCEDERRNRGVVPVSCLEPL